MDNFQKQEEYYKYVEQRRENFVDLTSKSNDSIVYLANLIFTKSLQSLDSDLAGLLIDDCMDIQDLFCMLVELVLHGLDILTENKHNVFDLQNEDDNIIDIIQKYLKSLGFKFTIRKIINNGIDDIRDISNYYCEILPKPPVYLCFPGWYVLNYRIIYAEKCIVHATIDQYRAIFMTNKKEIFEFGFSFLSKN
nr:hypothetical protein [Megavirus caiporensis]